MGEIARQRFRSSNGHLQGPIVVMMILTIVIIMKFFYHQTDAFWCPSCDYEAHGSFVALHKELGCNDHTREGDAEGSKMYYYA